MSISNELIIWRTIDASISSIGNLADRFELERQLAKLDCLDLKKFILECTYAKSPFWSPHSLTAIGIGIWNDFTENGLREIGEQLLAYGSEMYMHFILYPESLTRAAQALRESSTNPQDIAQSLYEKRCGERVDLVQALLDGPVRRPLYFECTYKDVQGIYLVKKYGKEIAPGLWLKNDMERRKDSRIFHEEK